MNVGLSSICPSCRIEVPAAAYFCPNCGTVIRSKPLSASIGKQVTIYAVSFFLPPFGLWYAWKYLRQDDRSLQIIGIVATALTIISIALTVWATDVLVNSANQSLNTLNGPSF